MKLLLEHTSMYLAVKLMISNNESGFTYPLTLITLVIFSLFLAYYCEQYVSEKQIFTLAEKLLKQEYYMKNALAEVEQQLQSGSYEMSGVFFYKNGEIDYNISHYSEELLKITFQGKLTTMEKWSGESYYDKNSDKMVKWVERR